MQFDLSNFTDTGPLTDAIRSIHYCNENTNTTGGLRLTRTEIFNSFNGDRSNIPDVILLVTDGNPTREADMLDEEVKRIKARGIRIVGVGVTNRVSYNNKVDVLHVRLTELHAAHQNLLPAIRTLRVNETIQSINQK